MIFLGVILSLLGIALGTPVGQLRAQLGDPLIVRPVAGVRVASYLRSDDPSAVLTVAERHGLVYWIQIERERREPTPGARDEYGIALGGSAQAIVAKRGKPPIVTMNTWLYPEDVDQRASTIYRLGDDTVEAIRLIGTAAPPGAPLPSSVVSHLAEASGATYESAIVDRSANAAESAHFRDRYLTVHDCSPRDRTNTNERRDGKTFAVMTASCGKRRHTFYFDLSPSK